MCTLIVEEQVHRIACTSEMIDSMSRKQKAVKQKVVTASTKEGTAFVEDGMGHTTVSYGSCKRNIKVDPEKKGRCLGSSPRNCGRKPRYKDREQRAFRSKKPYQEKAKRGSNETRRAFDVLRRDLHIF